MYLEPSVTIASCASFDVSVCFWRSSISLPVACPDPLTRRVTAMQPAAYVVSRHSIRFTQFSTSVHLAPWVVSHAVATTFGVLRSCLSVSAILEAFASIFRSSIFLRIQHQSCNPLTLRCRCKGIHCSLWCARLSVSHPFFVRFSNIAFISLALRVVSAKVAPCRPLFCRLIRRFAVSSLRRFHLLSFVAINVKVK